MNKDYFNVLSTVDCSNKIEKKNGLSYLSWAWAWNEFKKRYPMSYYTVYETPEGSLVWRDPVGGHVKTGVTVVWTEGDVTHELEHIEYLPIMDFRNKAIPYDNISSMDTNKTVQRSLTKAVARHGLGLFIYAGEDIPEEDTASNAELISSINDIISKKVEKMTADEKKDFANTIIVPIIGGVNYKACKDTEKLAKLLDKIKNI